VLYMLALYVGARLGRMDTAALTAHVEELKALPDKIEVQLDGWGGRWPTEHLLPIPEVVPLQLFSYFMALEHGVDVDRPRNLSKAVVEKASMV
jgi:glucosamine 6-phosphate synthetase-like amidotransferase/phosphosugar isomerase protein